MLNTKHVKFLNTIQPQMCCVTAASVDQLISITKGTGEGEQQQEPNQCEEELQQKPIFNWLFVLRQLIGCQCLGNT